MTFDEAQAILKSTGEKFDRGLSPREFMRIEQTFGLEFPADLRAFLAVGLPVTPSWVNWRDDTEQTIRDRLGWPLNGICFDIEQNNFWVQEWGDRPPQLSDAFAVAARALSAVPLLIPIYSHRYIPATPPTAGNPVFSVYQTDVIYYGVDLLDYLQNEFKTAFCRIGSSYCPGTRHIPFWFQLVGGAFEPPPGG